MATGAGLGARSERTLVLDVLSPVQIGGSAATDAETGKPLVTLLPPTLYGERGFGRVTVAVRGEGGIAVPEGVTVSQQAVSLDLSNFDWRQLPGGASLAEAAPIGVLRPEERAARKNAALSLGTANGPISVGAGAVVRSASEAAAPAATQAGW